MIINSQYLEGLVLSILNESAKGKCPYEIMNILRGSLNFSYSTIYTVCKRLVEKGFAKVDANPHIIEGRARKYYFITEEGRHILQFFKDAYHIEKDILERWL